MGHGRKGTRSVSHYIETTWLIILFYNGLSKLSIGRNTKAFIPSTGYCGVIKIDVVNKQILLS